MTLQQQEQAANAAAPFAVEDAKDGSSGKEEPCYVANATSGVPKSEIQVAVEEAKGGEEPTKVQPDMARTTSSEPSPGVTRE